MPEAGYTLDFDTAVETFDLPPPSVPAGETAAAVTSAAEAMPAEPAMPAPAPELDLELDFDVDAALAAEAPEPASEAAPAPDALPAHGDGRREPSFRFEAFELPEEELVAAALPDDAFFTEAPLHEEAPLHDGAEADAAAETETDVSSRGPAWAARLHPGEAEAAGPGVPDEDDEPGFVKQGRRREQTGRAVNVAMGVGAALLLVALLVQGMTTFRSQLAAFVPALKPTLVSACAALGCRIDLPAQIDALSIEQGELQTLAENTFSYASLLHNQSGSAQAWPSIELTLNDALDKPVLRRVFAPRDYLAAGVDPAKGFAPHSEQNVKLYFELAQLKASGYHIAVFYP